MGNTFCFLKNLGLFRKHSRVFGIGLSRTGTKSLNEALNIIGIRSIHFPRKYYLKERKSGKIPFSTLKKYEGFTDFPCWAIYKDLDKIYPGSKFILTVREANSWFVSRKNYHQKKINEGYKLGWDMSESSIDKMIKHNEEVKDYFKDRPGDLLVLNITQGEGWDKLCSFLGKRIPKVPFPRIK